MLRDVVKRPFVKDLQRYVPEVRSDELVFGPSGVRAQALGRDGALVDDFHLQQSACVAPRPQCTVPGRDRIAGHRRDARRASGVRVRAGWLIPRSTMARSDVSVSPSGEPDPRKSRKPRSFPPGAPTLSR